MCCARGTAYDSRAHASHRHWLWRAALPRAGNKHGAFVAEQRTVSSASRQAVLCIAISSATCRDGDCLHRIAHRIAPASAIELRGAVLRMLSRSPPPFEAMHGSATATRCLSCIATAAGRCPCGAQGQARSYGSVLEFASTFCSRAKTRCQGGVMRPRASSTLCEN